MLKELFNKCINKLKNRRLLVSVLLLFFVANIFAIFTTFTEKTSSTIWDGKIAKKFSGGDGSSTNPYIIKNGSELAYFFTLINSEDNSEYFNKFYELKNNINMDGRDFSFAKLDKTFSGSFDGNGYSVFNFTLDNYYLNEENEASFNLFDSLYSATIKNLNLSDITFNIKDSDLVIEEVVQNDDEVTPEIEKDTQEENKEEDEVEEETTDNKDEKTETKTEDKKEDKTETKEEKSESKNEEKVEDKTETKTEEKKDEIKTEDKEENKEPDKEPENPIASGTASLKKYSFMFVNNEVEDGNETNKEETKIEEQTEETKEEVAKDTKTEETIENKEETIKVKKIEKLYVSLFKNVKQSTISNVSVNNIKIKYDGDKKKIKSSLFILNDVENNKIENINISGKSSVSNTYVLIGNYSNAKIENVMFNSDNLKFAKGYKDVNETVFQYTIENGKLTFYENYPIQSVLEMFNKKSTLNWTMGSNKFRIQNAGKDDSIKTIKSINKLAPSSHDSGINGTTVYVNDYDADLHYYEGLNYTYSSDGKLPSRTDKNLYNEKNLVYVQINYFGTDKEGANTGYITNDKTENKMVYYKVYPVNDNGTSSKDDDYVEFELIDNPFTIRPNNKAFYSWVSDYRDAEIKLDMNDYVRYAKVPITYSGSNPNNIEINMYARWGNEVTTTYTGSWSTAFSGLAANGFHAISSVRLEYESVANLYVRGTTNNAYPTGAVNAAGETLTGNCNGNGCVYYTHPTNNTYNANTTYYQLVEDEEDGTFSMQVYSVQQIQIYDTEVPVGNNISGYYRKVTVPNGGSLKGYYNANGQLQTSGSCNTGGGCNNYYEYIQYFDNNDDEEVVVEGTIYYYLTTRDTNIMLLGATPGTTTWTNNDQNNKKFTLTAINNGTNNYSRYYLRFSGYNVNCYADTVIENLRTYSNSRSDANHGYWKDRNNRTITAGGLYGNYHNVKIGRNVNASASVRFSFNFAVGGNQNGTGSSSNLTKYRFIVESGFFDELGDTTGYGSNYSDAYVDATAIFGNDYDRVSEGDVSDVSDAANLVVKHTTAGSWSGYISGKNATDVMLHTIVKSGQYGSAKAAYTDGVYVGGLASGEHYSAREGIIEGGYIYNLIGGPLSQDTNKQYNDSLIYIKGGIVDVVVGGAGITETYGNRIIQMTGGTVRYAIFGGSNGVSYDNSSTTQNGKVDGDTYVYVGGNATVGDPTLVSDDAIESISKVEAGSVFGIGNGKQGYSSVGTVNNSYVIIDGNAKINRNVYGGGNYGATGQNGSDKNYVTNIKIAGGTINGSVYGAGNNNGAGKDEETTSSWWSTTTTPGNEVEITIDMTGGTVNGSIYGGSRTLGTVYGNTNINITGGTVVTDVYGGGEGGYTNNNNPGTFVSGNVDIKIGNTTSGPTINGSVYGGSAYGTVNETERNTTHNNKTVNVTVNNGNILKSVFGGAKGSSSFTPNINGDITVNVKGGTIGNVYGGFDEAGKPVGEDTVNISGGTIVNVFGGGNKTSIDETNVNVSGGTITTMYGGSNQLGDVVTTNINITGGSTGTVFGGNNEGGSCATTNITMNGGSVTAAMYGGGNLVGTTTTNIDITKTNNKVPNIYGGGNEAGATTTNVTINGNDASVGNVFGGSNQLGDITTTNVTLTKGSADTLYGGNNEGGTTSTSNVTINGGTATKVFGGGNEADTTNTHVTFNGGTVTTAFGGGNKAGATTTTITSTSNNAHVTTMFGGSNELGDVNSSTITIDNGVIGTIYGSNNEGGKTSTTNITVNEGEITNIFGGGNEAEADTSTITVNNATGGIGSIYGGGNKAGVTTTNITVGNDNSTGITVGSIYGGSNQNGNVGTSNITINKGTITDLYGGNNEGGTTGSANVTVNGSTITNLYGGGNKADTTTTSVLVNGGSVTNIYGGGNAADVTGNTSLTMLGGSVPHNIYGGGNEGEVGGNTQVLIHNATIGGSAYAGGNGSTATVHGNTSITVSGTTTVGTSSCTVLSKCSVFGGGNAATTGTETTNNSKAIVNITGATIYGNVYGGANTSKVYGETAVNIGDDVTLGTNIEKGTVLIKGTVFGGGEANASGSAEYDWSFVSVTKGTSVNINGNNYSSFDIHGSIFGSGNASTTSGSSVILIKNYGTFDSPKDNISIQRADEVTVDNSAIILRGATDRENDYATELFTLSRIPVFNLVNNSTLFLDSGANLLEEFNSLDSSGNKASVVINKENGTVTKSVDNRVYLLADKANKALNIAHDQNVTNYGEVNGMSFFGMFKYKGNGEVNVGIYDDYAYDATLDWAGVFDNVVAYVLGLHEANHDIKVDGFYSNFIDAETSKNKMDYINPTPENGPLYMWTIGEGVIEYEVDLKASKYSTLGTVELTLRDFTKPNTTFDILGFDFSELEDGVELVDKTDISKIAPDETTADNIMGLAFETSNSGWLTNGHTQFLSDETLDKPYTGTLSYVGGNSGVVPSLLIYLYHSKNLYTDGEMGSVHVQMLSTTQLSPLLKETKRLNIKINISRELFDTLSYEGSMTPGRKYEMFTSTSTNITSKSSYSTYFSLFNSGDNIYKPGYHRTLVSSYVFPVNTKITMIDLSGNTPKYYYHTITNNDVTQKTQELNNVGEASYDLSMFEVMGAIGSGVYYNDATMNSEYLHSNPDYAEEEFIFIVDFGDTNITSNKLNNKLLIELRDSDNQTIYSVLGPQHNALTYGIYANEDAIIDLDGTLSSYKIYSGDTVTADLLITYTQKMVGSTTVYDTHYFDSKLGIKVSLINSDGEVVTGTSLLGLYYELGESRYDPNIEGNTRIKIADKVGSAERWININTGTSSIASGNYKLRFESFGSPDGIFYGLESSDTLDFDIEIVNEIYGVDVDADPEEMIVNTENDLTEKGNKSITYNFKYNSGLTNPSIKFKMYRRNYNSVYDTTYTLVDADKIFSGLVSSGRDKEYVVENSLSESFNHTFNYKDNLKSGTYKLEFILYDGNSKIGTVEKYIIVK